MASTYFIDLDGCLFQHGSNNLLPGAMELLQGILDSGGEIVFTTYRGDVNFKGHRVYSHKGAMEGIRSLKIAYKTVIFDIDSPRVVINDSGAVGVNHKTNADWTEEERRLAIQTKE